MYSVGTELVDGVSGEWGCELCHSELGRDVNVELMSTSWGERQRGR